MRKTLLLLTALTSIAFVSTSCSSNKSCRGGSWYGNRNLGFEEAPKKEALETVRKEEVELEAITCR